MTVTTLPPQNISPPGVQSAPAPQQREEDNFLTRFTNSVDADGLSNRLRDSGLVNANGQFEFKGLQDLPKLIEIIFGGDFMDGGLSMASGQRLSSLPNVASLNPENGRAVDLVAQEQRLAQTQELQSRPGTAPIAALSAGPG